MKEISGMHTKCRSFQMGAEGGRGDAHFSINIEFECEKSTDNKYEARAKRPGKPPKTHVNRTGENAVTEKLYICMPNQRLSAKLSYALSCNRYYIIYVINMHVQFMFLKISF